MGPPGRPAALHHLQLAAGDAAGTDAHAEMTRVVLGSASPGRLGCCARPASIRWSSSPVSTRTPSSRAGPGRHPRQMSRPRWRPPRPTRSRTPRSPTSPPIALSSAVIRCCTAAAGLRQAGSAEAARTVAGDGRRVRAALHRPLRDRLRDDSGYPPRGRRHRRPQSISAIPSPADLDAYLASGEPTGGGGRFHPRRAGRLVRRPHRRRPVGRDRHQPAADRRLLDAAGLSISDSGRELRSFSARALASG